MSVVFYYMNILNCVYSFFSFCIFGMFLLLFTIVNDTSMNVHIQDFMWTYVSLFLGVYPEVELLGHVVQFSSVAQSCPTLCDPMNLACQASLSIINSRSLLKLMSIELIMPSNHLMSSPFLPALNLSQHQGLFQWVNSSHIVAKVLEFQPQHQSFQWTPRADLL